MGTGRLYRKPPAFSVIIPTFNRPAMLARCLDAVASQDFHRDRFEVIVVDDGSDRSPVAQVEAVKDRMLIRLLRQPNRGPASARNTGAAEARGRFLLFTDDDCMPHPRWLHDMSRHFSEKPDTGIGGRVKNALEENRYAAVSQRLIDYLYSYYNAEPRRATFLTSNNLGMPRDAFHRAGGFDTTFPLAAAEDREFCGRWVAMKNPLIYVDDAVVFHLHDHTFRSFWRQHLQYGMGAWRFHQIRIERENTTMLLEPAGFYVNMLVRGSSGEKGFRRIVSVSLLICTQLAHTTGYFRARWTRKPGRTDSGVPG